MPIPRRSLGMLAGAAATRWALGLPRSAAAAPVTAVADVVGCPKTELPTPALGVLLTVVSTNHAGRATFDGGFKAFATDRPIGPVCRDLPAVAYRFRGDEFGILSWADGPPPVQRGDRVELIPPHCDPTVNLYDRIHACRGDRVEAVWSVMDRLACGGGAGP
jgi:D-serine deaminase-like pyridoxal phosphate-dependent protein